MATRSGQKIKILYILKILMECTDENNPINSSEICEKLSEYGVTAERKAIYDDIKCLIDFGYDIIQTRTPKNGYFLASRDFETSEIYLLIDAVRTAKFVSEKKTRDLIAKLEKMLGGHQSDNIKGIYIDGKRKTKNEKIFYIIEQINDAIKKGKKITIEYRKMVLNSNRQIITKYRTHTVSPYALTWQDDYYYLICNNEKYDNITHFRVDRIALVNDTNESIRHFSEVSEYKDTFDVADYTKKNFSMYSGEIIEIKLRCLNSLVEQAFEQFGDDITRINVTEDTFDFYVRAAESETLVTWLTNYVGRIEVLKPESLRQKMLDRANKLLDVYK